MLHRLRRLQQSHRRKCFFSIKCKATARYIIVAAITLADTPMNIAKSYIPRPAKTPLNE